MHQDADLWLGKLSPGDCLSHGLAPGRHAWVHVAEGQLCLNGEVLSAGDAAALTEIEVLQLEGISASQVLVFDLA